MNEQLKYNKENLFNSPILQQYDSEGQRYFLSYLLKKNYDFEIKSGHIIFTNITSEIQIKNMLEEYNYETQKENIKTKIEATKQVMIFGAEGYNQRLKQRLKILKKKYENKERESSRCNYKENLVK